MTKDVYRIVTAEGHEYDYHGGVEQLQKAHPGAVITGRRVTNAVGESHYEPYSAPKARAAERKESADDALIAKVAAKATPAKPAKPAPKAETGAP